MASLRVAVFVLVLAGAAGTVGAQAPLPSEVSRARQECATRFTSLRSEVEKRGMAARNASEQQISREEMCKLVTAFGTAESKWVEFVEGNMSKCGIPQEIVAQLKTIHNKTADGQKKLCAVGARWPANRPARLEDVRDDDQNYRFGPPTQPKRRPLNMLDLTGR